MSAPRSRAVKRHAGSAKPVLSKGQKLFNSLTKRIQQARRSLEQWQALVPAYREKYMGEFQPVQKVFNERRAEMLTLLDAAHADKAFTAREKGKLSDIICEIAEELLCEQESEQLKQIYNRHSGGDFDAEMDEGKALAKEMARDMFGVDLPDDLDFDSPEALMAQLHEAMQRQTEQVPGPETVGAPNREARKKSAKANAQQARIEQEAQQAKQSVQQIYRKLVSALHPDREQDGAERVRKTALMQRATVAYGNNDLLALLELQLELEHIDEAALGSLSDERLKHYNKVLRDQADELEHECEATEFAFKMQFNLDPDWPLAPDAALHLLADDISSLRHAVTDIEDDLHRFQDRKLIKKWLKSYRNAPRVDHAMDLDIPF